MTDTDTLRAWLTLLRAPGVGAATLRAWLRGAGHIHAALALAGAERRLPAATRAWLRAPDASRLACDLAWLQQPGHRLLRCDEADFPPQLETIADPPAALWLVGDGACLLKAQIAVVGARRASAAGRANARLLAAALAADGLVVTSGLAHGIDAVAHAAALAAGQPTVAVMGTGPDQVYPRRHADLAARIAAAGVLVTEFPPGTGPRREHFPRRNRIISGLTLGTLVVEAGVRSGSLITARLAGEQGREVFAVPGSIHNPLARGCHRLIRDGARLVETDAEIVQALRPLALAQGADLARRLQADPAPAPAPALGPVPVPVPVPVPEAQARPADEPAVAGPAVPQRQRLLDALGWDEPVALDTLSVRSGLPAREVSALLLLLELDGQVDSQAGGRWLRAGASS